VTRSLRGLIFDLDGTLVDSLPGIAAALNAGLGRRGLGLHDAERVRQWVGDGVPALVRRAAPDLEDEERRAVENEMVLRFTRAPSAGVTAYAGVREALARLREAGIALAVLSNKEHAATRAVVEAVLGGDWFAAVQGLEEERLRKPDPTTALRLLDILGLPSDAVGLVGDSEVDVETARRAGLRSFAVTWGFRPAGEVRRWGADVVIDHPSLLFPFPEAEWPGGVNT